MRRRWNAIAASALLSFGGAACATSSSHLDLENDPVAARAHEEEIDELALAVTDELARGDFAAVRERFDSTMRWSLPRVHLQSLWESLAEPLGARGPAPTISLRANDSKYDTRRTLQPFELGSAVITVSFHRRSKQIAGLFLAPGPRPPKGDIRAEEVQVGEEPFLLGGTLTSPPAPGRHPAVVLVHGSGPNDRDSTVGASRPLKDIAEGLASRGIIALRYDKRTFQYRGKLGPEISVDDEVIIDALAAIRLLQQREDVDPSKIFVVGHSLGALLAPEIATRSKVAAGTVLLAPPGKAPWESVLAQLQYLAAPKEEIAKAEAAAVKLRAGDPSVNLLGVPGSYWLDVASRDGISTAQTLGKPMLILHGDRDYQVVEEDIAAWRASLGDLLFAEFETFTGANHLFIDGEGKPGPSEYGKPGAVREDVIDRIAAFVLQEKRAEKNTESSSALELEE